MEIFPKVNLDQYTPPPMVYTAVYTRIHKIHVSAKCVDSPLYFGSYNNHSHVKGLPKKGRNCTNLNKIWGAARRADSQTSLRIKP